jgi:hypothetical protein
MLVQRLDVYKQFILVKFQQLIVASSLDDADFVILDEDDNEVTEALLPIDVERDYNSISRSVRLWFDDGIEPDTTYTLVINGLKNIINETYDEEAIEFETLVDTTSNVELEPLQPDFYVVDHSVANVSFGTGGGDDSEPATPVDELEFVGSSPTNNSIFNEEDDEYQVQITFSHELDLSDIDSLVTVQKRKMSYLYTQWEDVELTETIEATSPPTTFVVRFASDDENYKYRIIINKALTDIDDELALGEDVTVTFTNLLTPFYSNTEEITDFYPETTELEAAELIHRYSLEVQKILGLSDSADPPFVAVEYVTAAVLCRLAIQAGDVLGANGNADDITLGDFRVSSRVGGTSSSARRATRESATNWCELAAAIKREVRSKNRIPRTWVRSGRHKNPIPSRYFKDLHTFKNRNSPRDYGLINDD